MNEVIPEIGNRVAEFRKKQNLSQQDVADATGLSRPYVAQVESGRSNPSFKFLYQLRMNYNLSVDWLLSGRGEMIVSEKGVADEMTERHYELIKKLIKLNARKQDRLIGGFLEIIESD
jgi:transcriptional regulator with XRE-family HTH domain